MAPPLNPYHAPETALAILTVAAHPHLWGRTSKALRLLVEGMHNPPQIGQISTIRALEICLSRVRMYEDMRRDCMALLITERGNRERAAAYGLKGPPPVSF